MDADALIDHLESQGVELADAARRRGLDAPVAGLDWDVRSLVAHTGGVHRWAATVVRGGSEDEIAAADAQREDGVPDDELLDWYRGGHATLVATLREAPADLDVFTFLAAESPRHFWARRQAHETAIHRADAAGHVVFDPAFAQDGIAEIFAFGSRRKHATARQACVSVRPVDGPSWTLRFGGERIVVEPGHGSESGPADAVVTGTSSELYLWLWNRPSEVRVEGDSDLAGLWGTTVRIR